MDARALGMFGKLRISRWLVGTVVLAVLECAGLAAVNFAWPVPAQAQWYSRDERYPFLQRRSHSGGFFQDLFGPYHPREREYEPRRRTPHHVDHSRAPPPPRKAEKSAPPPSTTIVVMGDGMSDWLAYGLEEAFADTPTVGVVRKSKLHSGLIRYDSKNDLDWWHVARDILTQEKANYVVMMLGLNDRENIRERDLAKEAEKQKAEKEAAEKKKEEKNGDKSADKDKDKDKQAAEKKKAAEPPKPKPSNVIIEFRSDRWAAVYAKRIDETIAALKSKGVPVFWVGLPSIRGTKSTADAVYLNNLYRARAERAGIVYIDVWDGFVDDGGKYSSFGPDYEGQIRRLRSSDGVFFTNYGARKLAHYAEREIRRYMSNRSLRAALPAGPVGVPKAGKSTERPEAGPVIPLTATSGTTDELLGGAGNRAPHGDSVASRVLVNGEPVSTRPGRADDFAWPPGSDANRPAQPAPAESKPAGDQQSALTPATTPPAAPGNRKVRIVTPTANPADAEPKKEPKKDKEAEHATVGTSEETAQNAQPSPPPQAAVKPKPTHSAPRRQHFRLPFSLDNPFGLFR